MLSILCFLLSKLMSVFQNVFCQSDRAEHASLIPKAGGDDKGFYIFCDRRGLNVTIDQLPRSRLNFFQEMRQLPHTAADNDSLRRKSVAICRKRI